MAEGLRRAAAAAKRCDDAYMKPGEFAALPPAVHHAVWQALTDRRIDTFPPARGGHLGGAPLRYRREQVRAIERELKAAAAAGEGN